jgi:hypothetical protein
MHQGPKKAAIAQLLVAATISTAAVGCGGGSNEKTSSATVAAATPKTASTGTPQPPTLQPAPNAQPVKLPASVVATVAGQPITKAQLDRRRAAAAKAAGGIFAADPPAYTKCVVSLRAMYRRMVPPNSKNKPPIPKRAALVSQCRERSIGLIAGPMNQLIRATWDAQEAKAAHIAVSQAEVAKALASQRAGRGGEKPYRAYLKRAGLTPATRAQQTHEQLLTQKLAAHRIDTVPITDAQVDDYLAENEKRLGKAMNGLSRDSVREILKGQAAAKLTEKATAEWRAKTLCRPGYVVPLCANG